MAITRRTRPTPPSIVANAKLSRRAFTAGAAASLVSLAACSGEETVSADETPDDVTYVTNFGSLGRDSYAWVAQDRDFFAGHRLDVAIEPGTGTQDNLQLLLGGQAQFTTVDFAGAVLARGNDVQGFTVLAAIQQRNLAAVMTIDPSITNPRDLEGKTVGFPTGAVTELLFPTYCSLANVDIEQVRMEPLEPASLASALAGGQVDAIGQFVVGQPLIEAAADAPVTVLPYSEYITDLYGVALLTSVELAEEDPDLCVRFRDALLQGLQYAIDHPDEAGDILVANNPDGNPDVAAQEMALMAPYTQTEPGTPLGAMDPAQVTRAIGILQGAGAAPAGIIAEELVSFDLTPGTGEGS